MTSDSFSPQEKVWLHEGLSDYVGIWQIVRRIEETEGAEGDDVKTRVLQAVGRLLTSGAFVAVDLVEGGGFALWPGTPQEILDRLRDEWDERGRPPNVPDMPWLKLTEEGRRAVEESG